MVTRSGKKIDRKSERFNFFTLFFRERKYTSISNMSSLFFYEKKDYIVMANNFTNTNKANNHLTSHTIKHQKDHDAQE